MWLPPLFRDRLSHRIEVLKTTGAFRFPQLPQHALVDFSSNDYLSLARSPVLRERVRTAWEQQVEGNLSEARKEPVLGSTGSRLLTGHSHLAEQVETWIRGFHQTEAALLFNSGYDANLAVAAVLPQRGDTVFYDQRVHASLREGVRLGWAHNFSFRHNDLEDLAGKFSRSQGQAFVVVESVYSMDGDLAPLVELTEWSQANGVVLIVDEAHATGVFGKEGRGFVDQLGLGSQIGCRVHTFGKALGTHGAAVVGSRLVTDFLTNFARSLIYTTSLPPHSLVSIEQAYRYLPEAEEERAQLRQLIQHFRKHAEESVRGNRELQFLESISPIQGIVVPGNDQVVKLANQLQHKGFDVRPIRSPTIPKNEERIRICLHAHNTAEEIDHFFASLKSK